MIIEIIILVCFVFFLLASLASSNETSEGFFNITCLIGLIFFIGFFVGVSDRYSFDKTVEIISLDRTSGVTGSFVMGSGHIENIPVYYAYTKTEDGGYKILKIEDVVLYESNETPVFEVKTTCKRKTNWINWYGECKTTRKLIVPNNTIIQEFRG